MSIDLQRARQLISDAEHELRDYGFVRDFAVHYENDQAAAFFRIILKHGEILGFRMTDHEINMGGEGELRRFLDEMIRECRHACERAGWPNLGYYRRPAVVVDLAASQDRTVYRDMWREIADGMTFTRGRITHGRERTATEVQESHREAIRILSDRMRCSLDDQFAAMLRDGFWFHGKQPDPKADQKAKDLFLLVAGRKNFDCLNSGKPISITGSKGTAYRLFRQASFCIERVIDGAKLCAVVPGVPLWDHLLGIKLMVENDEPKFLSIANVMGGSPVFRSRSMLPGESWARYGL